MNPSEAIHQWAQEGEHCTPTPWDRMPEIYLYMDQVITYMHSQLSLFERTEDSPLLTSSMINNYVKNGVLERPDKKKYSRDHLATLMVICMLKQVLSLQDISSLLKASLNHGESRQDLYETYSQAQTKALQQVCKRVEDCIPQGEDALYKLAMELAVEANARRAAAERILCELGAQKEESSKKEKKESSPTSDTSLPIEGTPEEKNLSEKA